MGREGERHLLLIAPSCGQAAPISAARSCSRQGAGWGERARSACTAKGSGAGGTPRGDSPPSAGSA